MHLTTKKTTILVLSLFALLVVGVGYAQWVSQAQVTGVVNTATLNVEWSDPRVDYVLPMAHVTCSATVTPGNPHSLTLEMHNATPDSLCVFSVDLVYTGSIAVNVITIHLDVPEALELRSHCLDVGDLLLPAPGIPSQQSCTFDIIVSPTAEPGETYNATLTFEFAPPIP